MVNSILVATDGSPQGRKAVDMATDVATKYDSGLKILHVMLHGELSEELRHMAEVEHLVHSEPVQHPAAANLPAGMMLAADSSAEYSIEHEVFSALADRIVDRAVTFANEAGVHKVTSEIVEGDAAEEILKAAEQAGADLVVLGSRGLGTIQGLLHGSVSQKVGQQAKCSCLIVH